MSLLFTQITHFWWKRDNFGLADIKAWLVLILDAREWGRSQLEDFIGDLGHFLCFSWHFSYPNRSMVMGGEEGGVCMDPAIVNEDVPLAQWALWWSPFNLSGGVSMPPPPSTRFKEKISFCLNSTILDNFKPALWPILPPFFLLTSVGITVFACFSILPIWKRKLILEHEGHKLIGYISE